MADDKKKKKGSGAGKIYIIGIILGILVGICLGWIIPAPDAFKQKVDDTKKDAKEATDKAREKAADAIRPDGKTKGE